MIKLIDRMMANGLIKSSLVAEARHGLHPLSTKADALAGDEEGRPEALLPGS